MNKRNFASLSIFTLFTTGWLILSAQLHLPAQTPTGFETKTHSYPQLKINQLSTEWDDWVYSHDGQIVAYSSQLSEEIQLMNTSDKRTIAAFPYRGVLAIAESGSTVAIGTQKKELIVWNSDGIRSFEPESETQISSINMTPDGRRLVTGDNGGSVRYWDIPTGKLLWSVKYRDKIQALTLSNDGSRVFICWGSGAIAGTIDSGSEILDGTNGKSIKKLDNNDKYGIIAGAMSGDGKIAVTVRDVTYGINFWDTQSRKKSLLLPDERIGYVALSKDGKKIAALSDRGIINLIDTTTNKTLIRKIDTQNSVFPGFVKKLQFINKDLSLMVAVYDYGSVILSVDNGKVLDTFSQSKALPVPMESVNVSFAGNLVLGQSDHLTTLWDIFRGTVKFQVGSGKFAKNILSIPLPEAKPETCDLKSSTISPDELIVAGITCNGSIILISPDGNIIKEFDKLEGKRWFTGGMLHFSPDGRYLVGYVTMHSTDQRLIIWDKKADKLTGIPLNNKIPDFIGFNTSKQSVWLVSGKDMYSKFSGFEYLSIDLGSGKINKRETLEKANYDDVNFNFKGIAVSPDGHYAAYANYAGGYWLKDFHSNAEVLLTPYKDFRYGITPKFSPDQNLVILGGGEGPLIYDLKNGSVLENKTFKDLLGFRPRAIKLEFSANTDDFFALSDGRLFKLSSKSDGDSSAPVEYKSSLGEIKSFSQITRKGLVIAATSIGIDVFDQNSGRLLGTLITLNEGPWVTLTPDGKFDTENPENLGSLSWIMNDDRLHPLPIDIFMRDYYEPRLMSKLLDPNYKFAPIPSVASLNRIQPDVKISNVTPVNGSLNVVSVTVEVTNVSGMQVINGQKTTLQSGVFDLRLFRDGQLVSYLPGKFTLDENGKALVRREVKIPKMADLKEIEFEAYAFNVDRVKSNSSKFVYSPPQMPAPIKGRAYIISVGVNAYEDSAWDLTYAASDADITGTELFKAMSGTGTYSDVIPVTLISDYIKNNTGKNITKKLATKKNFETILKILAYGPEKVSPELISQIPEAKKLKKVEPEDVVLINFSSHGYTDKKGKFYLVPFDTGDSIKYANDSSEISLETLSLFISSDEVAEWVRDIDARELVMIIDTCHSAGAVDEPGFKPGPMGSKGMGQLVYDKGMNLLAASQADDVAFEIGKLKQGLLTYSLIREGLEAKKADTNNDGKITLREWLRYGEQRVPQLYSDVKEGKIQEIKRKDIRITGVQTGTSVKKNAFQKPSLFAFKPKKQDVLIALL